MTEPTAFPTKDRPPLLIGPFESYKVVVEGHAIPRLTGWPQSDGKTTTLIVDERFGVDVPNELAPQIAWLVANALAVGAGYSHLGALNRDQPFAPMAVDLGGDEP